MCNVEFRQEELVLLIADFKENTSTTLTLSLSAVGFWWIFHMRLRHFPSTIKLQSMC